MHSPLHFRVSSGACLQQVRRQWTTFEQCRAFPKAGRFEFCGSFCWAAAPAEGGCKASWQSSISHKLTLCGRADPSHGRLPRTSLPSIHQAVSSYINLNIKGLCFSNSCLSLSWLLLVILRGRDSHLHIFRDLGSSARCRYTLALQKVLSFTNMSGSSICLTELHLWQTA